MSVTRIHTHARARRHTHARARRHARAAVQAERTAHGLVVERRESVNDLPLAVQEELERLRAMALRNAHQRPVPHKAAKLHAIAQSIKPPPQRENHPAGTPPAVLAPSTLVGATSPGRALARLKLAVLSQVPRSCSLARGLAIDAAVERMAEVMYNEIARFQQHDYVGGTNATNVFARVNPRGVARAAPHQFWKHLVKVACILDGAFMPTAQACAPEPSN